MKDYKALFSLRPIKAAKVSEISESTASSPVPAAERVNFHIGNPVQDDRLIEYFLRSVLSVKEDFIFDSGWEEKIIEDLNLELTDKPLIRFFDTLIRKSAPYTPRGGYLKTNPHELINTFRDWLLKDQQEALPYDVGEKSGRREIILSSGGMMESLRVFIHALSNYMVSSRVNLLLFHQEIPSHILEYRNINFITLPDGEVDAILFLKEFLENNFNNPNFLMLGAVPSEEIRRKLRELCISYPLLFVETNNAFNHQSLAREAKMVDRVIRFLTPEIFCPDYNLLSTIFIAGNSDFLNVIETVHFQLKGTPSASEMELLNFLIKSKAGLENTKNEKISPNMLEAYESNKYSGSAVRILVNIQESIDRISAAKIEKITSGAKTCAAIGENISLLNINRSKPGKSDYFAFINFKELFDKFLENINSETFYESLSDSFL